MPYINPQHFGCLVACRLVRIVVRFDRLANKKGTPQNQQQSQITVWPNDFTFHFFTGSTNYPNKTSTYLPTNQTETTDLPRSNQTKANKQLAASSPK